MGDDSNIFFLGNFFEFIAEVLDLVFGRRGASGKPAPRLIGSLRQVVKLLCPVLVYGLPEFRDANPEILPGCIFADDRGSAPRNDTTAHTGRARCSRRCWRPRCRS